MSGYTVTTSAELMENYLQADYLVPQDTFTALQTDGGASLLFSVGTDGALYLTMEVPGVTSGWRQVNLSAAQIRSDFANQAKVTTLGAAQTVSSQTGVPTQIHLGMVVNDGTNDHLYLSLGYSDTDLSWAQQPVWTPAPFNALDGNHDPVAPPSPLQIVNVLLGEATDQEYVVVDIIRQGTEFVTRFWIDTTDPTVPRWTLRNIPIDVEATTDFSCLGRSASSHGVDGIYTKGSVATSGQLIYTPVHDWLHPTDPPSSSTLYLPNGLIPDAIAAARNADTTNTSDLYVAAQGGLYWFASDNQRTLATGELVVTSPLLAAVRRLFAATTGDSVTVWGLNGDDTVFYLTCPVGQQQTATAWNTPLTILSGVDAISPFLDRAYSANTFFAHSATGLSKVVKSPTTGLWTSTAITLPPSDATQAPTPVHSYTTHIQVTDSTGQQASGVAVTLTATNVTSVYVNHLYYLVGPSPIELTTDQLGTITVVEVAASLAATRFQVSVAGQPQVAVNTMDTAWQRNASYTSVASLQQATIVSRDGTARPLVPAGTSTANLQAVADSNRALGEAYAAVSTSPTPPSRAQVLASSGPVELEEGGVLDGLLVDLGDLVSWLRSGVDAVVELVQDVAHDVWHLVVTIAGAVYHAALDCVEAVMAAATWVYHAIKIAVDDVLAFLEFLFDWQDIRLTHRVLKNVFLCLGQSVIDGVEAAKVQMVAVTQQLQSQVDSWANIPAFPQTPAETAAANPPLAQQNSAPASLGIHHFQGNAAASSSSLSAEGPAESILDDLVTLVQSEGDTLSDAANAILTDIIDAFATMSLTDVITKFLAIVADTVLSSTENVLTTVLDVFAQLVEGMMDVLRTPLDIPVLSWLYHDLTGEDLSFLDVVCLVAAIPVTIIYKAAAQAAPFPANDAFTEGLVNAPDLAAIQALFVVPSNALAAPAAVATTPAPPGTAPVLDQTKLKTFAFVTGIASLAGTAVLTVVTGIQRTFDLVSVNVPYAKTIATIGCVGNIAYVSPNISTLVNAETDQWYAELNNALTGVSILKGIALIPAAAFSSVVANKVFGFVETFINVVWNVPVIVNIIDHKDVWDTTYKSLVPESIGNFSFNLGGILEFPIALLIAAENVEALAVVVPVQYVLMARYGVCMIIAGSIYRFAPNQSH